MLPPPDSVFSSNRLAPDFKSLFLSLHYIHPSSGVQPVSRHLLIAPCRRGAGSTFLYAKVCRYRSPKSCLDSVKSACRSGAVPWRDFGSSSRNLASPAGEEEVQYVLVELEESERLEVGAKLRIEGLDSDKPKAGAHSRSYWERAAPNTDSVCPRRRLQLFLGDSPEGLDGAYEEQLGSVLVLRPSSSRNTAGQASGSPRGSLEYRCHLETMLRFRRPPPPPAAAEHQAHDGGSGDAAVPAIGPPPLQEELEVAAAAAATRGPAADDRAAPVPPRGSG